MKRPRVRPILQMNSAECGLASLAMVMDFYGRTVSVAECCDRQKVSGGVTARTLAEIARRFGMKVEAYTLEPAELARTRLPAIIHWNFNHFMVLERWTADKVDVVDPACGRRALSAAEFDDGFTGVVLVLSPTPEFAPRKGRQTPLWPPYLRGILRRPGVAGIMGNVLAVSLLTQFFGLLLPILTKVVVDNVLPGRSPDLLLTVGVGALALAIALAAISYLRSASLVYLQGHLDPQVMLGFFEHLLSLPFTFFQQRMSGDLLMRLASNAYVRETLTNQTLSALLDGTFVIGYFVLLLVAAPPLAALTLGIGILQAAVVLGTTRRFRELMQRELLTQAESQAYAVEVLGGMATVKASGTEDRVLKHWTALFYKYLNVSQERGRFSAVVDSVSLALRTLTPLALLWVGAYQVLNGKTTLGTMLALNALAASMVMPMVSLASTFRQLQVVGAHLARIADVMEAEPEQDRHTARRAPTAVGRIELQHVCFRYSLDSPWVVRDVSAVIEPGSKTAIVGPTGSGKSTLAMLLLGIYQCLEGQILIDGVPLRDLDYRALRRHFGVVTQDPFLFRGSVRENIALHDPYMPFDRVVRAARLAAIHDEVLAMPMGYETPVGEGGGALSGGQRQRVALARALAREPSALLLDEATSHLDGVTESAVHEHLAGFACTRIVIAHRLSTVRDADVILVLDGGRVAEQGSHQRLLGRRGCYASLIASQFESAPGELVEAMNVNCTGSMRDYGGSIG